jgi:zinc protease
MSKQLLVLSLFCAVAGAANAGEPRKVATVEGITEYNLDNGLKVLLFPDGSKPTVTVNLTVFVGSRHEGYGETGMAHLLEHMLFKGTPTHKNVPAELQDHGARFNGTTSYDRTNYFETVTASDANLQWALDLEADRLVHSNVAKKDLETEFSVVRNEFEMGENAPVGVLYERMLSTAYLWHNYGKSTIGSRSDIERVPIDNLQAFYHRYYQPDNAMVIVAGKFDTASTLKLVNEKFGKLPRPQRVLKPTYTQEPVQDGERSVVLRRTGDVGAVGLIYHFVSSSHADYVAEEALLDVLTHKPTGRLYKALVDKGLAASVNGDAMVAAEPGVLALLAEVPLGKSPELVRDKMIDLTEALAKGGITDEEVQRFKTGALKDIELALANSGRIGIELSEWAATGDWRLLFLHRDAVKALTTAHVNQVASKYLRSANRTAGLFLPTKAPDRAPLPDQPDVTAMVKSYKGQEQVAQGEEFAATVANIEKRTERVTLPSGMRLALLPKKTRGQAVKIVLKINAGSEKDLKGQVEALSLLPEMLMRGSKKHNYQQLQDQLDQLRAEVRAGDFFGRGVGMSRANEAKFTVTTVRESVPKVLALLTEIVREPAFPKDQFETLKKERLAALEDSLQQPDALAMSSLIQKAQPYPKDDPRHHASPAESVERVKAVKLEQLAAFHKNFWGATNAELVMVGDFDAAQVKEQVSKELATWKSPKAYQRLQIAYREPTVADEVIDTPDKQMALVGVAQPLEIRDDDAQYPALALANFVLGGGFKSRLVDRLRQKEGLSYGASSAMMIDAVDKGAVLLAFAMCAPQNATKAMTGMLEELTKLVQKGVAGDELAAAKQAWKAQLDNRLASDDAVAGMLMSSFDANRTLAYWDTLAGKVQALTAPELTSALTQWVKPDQLVKVKAGDLKNPKLTN